MSAKVIASYGEHRIVRIVAFFDPATPETPRALRERFVEAMRGGIQRAYQVGEIDIAQAEELWRALPKKGRA